MVFVWAGEAMIVIFDRIFDSTTIDIHRPHREITCHVSARKNSYQFHILFSPDLKNVFDVNGQYNIYNKQYFWTTIALIKILSNVLVYCRECIYNGIGLNSFAQSIAHKYIAWLTTDRLHNYH